MAHTIGVKNGTDVSIVWPKGTVADCEGGAEVDCYGCHAEILSLSGNCPIKGLTGVYPEVYTDGSKELEGNKMTSTSEWIKVTWDCGHWLLIRAETAQVSDLIRESYRWPRRKAEGNCPNC